VSDADWTVYEEQRRRFEPFGEDEAERILRLDTDGELHNLSFTVESALRQRIASATIG
jgi:predicted kinase